MSADLLIENTGGSSHSIGHSGTSNDAAIKEVVDLTKISVSHFANRKPEYERLEALLTEALKKPTV